MRPRRFVAIASALAAVVGLAAASLAACSGAAETGRVAPPASQTTTTRASCTHRPDACTTRQAADAAGVTLGTAVAASHLDQADYRRTLLETFNSITPENELKWSSIHPTPDTWNFGPADQIVDFAQANDLQVKGHNLIWDQKVIGSTPDWVLRIDDPAELRRVIRDHITTVMHRYRGKVDRWDVVNEPLDTVGSGLYDNHFRHVLGDDYVAEMFRIAHEADPEAHLFLNEAAVEYQPAKAGALIALVKRLVDEGTPIDGVGVQGHLISGSVEPGVLRTLFDELRSLGVAVAITELDIPTSSDARPLDAQATVYGQVLAECLDASCREVTTWGFTDRYTWIDDFLGPGRAPLPFDRSYRPKSALNAIRDELLLHQNGN